MITFCRSANVMPGQAGAAIEFAKKMQAFMKEAHGVELEVRLPFGGNPYRISWVSRYPDLAALDAFHLRILADQQYWKIVGEYKETFLPGSVDDEVWRTI